MMALHATAATLPAVGRSRTTPGVMAVLVLPSLAVTPCLWIGVASRGAGGPGLTIQVVALSGLLATLAGANGARAYSHGAGEGVRTTRRWAEVCLAICAGGVALAALTAALATPAALALLTLAMSATAAVVLTGLLRGDRRMVLAGATGANLAWSADLVLLAILAVRALLPSG